jgi:phage antirepressor YoqD-like protein
MGIGRNKLFRFLRDKGILQIDNMPYQRMVDAGYFKVVEGKYEVNENVVVTKTTYVKQKGIDYIRKLLSKKEDNNHAETD